MASPGGHTGTVGAAVRVAHQAADAAAGITRKYFRKSQEDLGLEAKADDSPVTVADREAEKAMRRVIHESFPEHLVYGEELGTSTSASASNQYVWINPGDRPP